MGSDASKRIAGAIAQSFNSRSRMGSDTTPYGEIAHFRMFQFTLPHGERPPSLHKRRVKRSFNSRSRMGSDLWEKERR